MMWPRQRGDNARKETTDLPVELDLEQAWKTLSLVTDWLRHAEAKLGIILAFTGVSAGVLFNLVQNQEDGSCLFNIAAVVCGVAVVTAGACAMLGLLPVVRLGRQRREEATNLIYFHDIARTYEKASSYTADLRRLTTTPKDVVRYVGQQVHANACVASRKYQFATCAMWALLVALLALGSVAAIAALGW